ncbi:MAG: crotonase/enoyl-CoA hydratase family protein [Saprospiraceae bacterium]
MSKIISFKEGHVFVVTINLPKYRNAINAETADLLFEAFSQFEADPDLYVAVLTGANGVFCAGADLKSIASGKGAPELSMDRQAPLGVSRMKLSKPVIAAVEGYAVAGGLELALWCDMRIASEKSIFGVYCRRFGVPLVDGGTIRLPRLIGHSRAMDMILTGRGVDSEEALQMGLINRVVAKGTALEAAIGLAQELSRLPQKCMRSDRLSAIEQWDVDLESALMNETKRGLEVISSGEALDGAKRFIKRQY